MLSSGPATSTIGSQGRLFWLPEPPFGTEYGLFHLAPREGVNYLPGLLLVFVHGINSDPVACWGSLPEALLAELGRDIDILNFRFPAQ